MSKKTESIEIRVSPEQKARLAQMSAAQGETMSGFLRRLADQGAGAGPQTGDRFMAKLAKHPSLLALPFAIAAGFGLSLSGPVTASPEYRMAFAQMDINGDGVVTEAEMLASFGDLGDMSDADLLEELPQACAGDVAAFRPPSAEELRAEAAAEMALLDGDNDGRVVYEDLAGMMMRQQAELFLELDADENGFLSPQELADDGEFMALAMQDDQAEDEDDVSEACREALEVELLDAAGEAIDAEDMTPDEARLMLAELDADRDGRVSLLEFLVE